MRGRGPAARAASGHAAAPPMSVMKSRRLRAGMGYPVQPVSSTLSLARTDRPILGAILNRSERAGTPAASPAIR